MLVLPSGRKSVVSVPAVNRPLLQSILFILSLNKTHHLLYFLPFSLDHLAVEAKKGYRWFSKRFRV